MRIETGSARLAREGDRVCGDVAAVFPIATGKLLCLADGLGHGERAMAAAEQACAYVGANTDRSLDGLLRGLDQELSGSRGAAVSLLVIHLDARKVQFAGIGNVELRAVSPTRIAPPTMPGIVGQRIRTPRVWDYPLTVGDILALTSDGISSRYDLAVFADLTAQRIADGILLKHRKSHDDACALVARIEAD